MSDRDRIKFKYIFDKCYNPIYVNGAIGGINLKGEIIINFYLERHGLPISQAFEIDENGKVGDEIERKPEDLKESTVRFVQNGVILSLESAKRIHKWLGKHIVALEELSKQNLKEERE
ncbi:MAG: hypothetical protein JXB26_01385 [Candidatus Aminicenantes bacterium]|nr:hypothetical protein [Candidatus Aminicenantes bacterium]